MRQWARLIVGSVVILHLKLFTAVTKRPRVRVMVINEKGQLLLIRTFLSHGNWTLPGGGVKMNEAPRAAARREVAEETGIDADETRFEYVITFARPLYAVSFTAPLYRVKVDAGAFSEQKLNRREVAVAKWFDVNSLPSSVSLITRLAVDRHLHEERGALRT